MRRVLILSPHFVPSDLPDMQRVRVCAGYLPDFGWEPHVLCVDSITVGRERDEALGQTVPTDLPVTTVGALPRLPGFNAIGLRAYAALAAAGARLLETNRFDLVFVSTTAFPVMHLAARWREKYGVPFVLDFQDPWGIFPDEAQQFLSTDLKSRIMQGIHQRLERATVTRADALVAVSQRYIDTLQQHYGLSTPALVQPFPYCARDFDVAGEPGRTDAADTIRCICLGRIPDAMREQLRRLLSHVRQQVDTAESCAGEQALSLQFIGTTYDTSQTSCIAGLVTEFDLQGSVSESTSRISYLASLAEMKRADVLVLPGSSDTSYLPSRVTQYLASGRPIVLVADGVSQLYQRVAACDGVLAIDSSQAPIEGFDFHRSLTDLLRVKDYGPRGALEARTATEQLTSLFDRVMCD